VSLRAGGRLALNSPRLLGVVAAVVATELAVRGLVAVILSPVWAIVSPPIVLVAGISGLVPGVRAALAGDPPDTLADWWTRPPFVPVVGVAIGGHAFALLAGFGIFLLVDTPIRMALYWTGNGWLIGALVVLIVPVLGTAFGTVAAWGVVAPAVTWAVEGTTARTALRRALALPVAAPRRALVGLARGTGMAVVLSAASVPALWLLTRPRPGRGPALPEPSLIETLIGSPVIQALAAGGGLWLLVGTLCVWVLLPASLERDPVPDRRLPALSAARVGLAVVLVIAAVGGASAVRVTEAHPAPEREPLPDDPGKTYGTALENTERSDHYYRFLFWSDNASERQGYEWWIDRTDRQLRHQTINFAGLEVYTSTSTTTISPEGTFSSLGMSVIPFIDGPDFVPPLYHLWIYAHDNTNKEGGYWVPPSTVDDWRVVNRSDGRVVLAITDPMRALKTIRREFPADRVTDVDAARARVVIDTETRTLRRYEGRFNATLHHDRYENGTRRYDGHTEATFRVGVDVKRPAELGPRSPSEWFWKLLAY